MRRGRGATPGDVDASEPVIPLDPMSVLAGIAPGLVLEVDPLPAGIAGNAETEPMTVSVEEVGRLLRCGEPTVRRLIRTAVLKPVLVDGEARVRREDVDAYRNAMLPRSADKPSE
jgi:excisionase family DNA binding protein